MKKTRLPIYKNWILKIGSKFLKKKIETDLNREDLELTTGKIDAIPLTVDEAITNQKKILSSYPELLVTFEVLK